jgi:UPF0271 protein
VSACSSIDLNADVGEGCGLDGQIVPLVSSVNIACGGHAGDPSSMREALLLARENGVAAGAHPGFEDREHFGRRELPVGPAQAAGLVAAQTRRLADAAARAGVILRHVKLHGALYNMAARDPLLAGAVVGLLLEEFGGRLALVALAGSVLEREARGRGLAVRAEAFADRGYAADGSLAPRSAPGAVLELPGRAALQALGIAREGRVTALDGTPVSVQADTICIHGDRPQAAEFARAVRGELERAGIRVAPRC